MNKVNKKTRLCEALERLEINLRLKGNKELGSLAGVNRDTIARWKSGKSSPRIVDLDRLCESAGIDLNQFINWYTGWK